MKTFGFTDTNDFAEFLADMTDKMSAFNRDDYSEIHVVAKYDVMKDVLNSLIKETNLELVSCTDFNDPDWDGYDDAYVLVIDPDMGVWVDRAKYTTDEYINMDETDIVFVHGDVDSAFVKQNEDSGCIMHEFNIGEDAEYVSDECDGECENCSCAETDDTDDETRETDCYEINGKCVSKEEFYKAYLDEVKELAKWCGSTSLTYPTLDLIRCNLGRVGLLEDLLRY